MRSSVGRDSKLAFVWSCNGGGLAAAVEDAIDSMIWIL
jgi:hypothetical protein